MMERAYCFDGVTALRAPNGVGKCSTGTPAYSAERAFSDSLLGG